MKSLKDIQRAAHSQGYNVSEPKERVGDHYSVDLTHRKTGQKVNPASGGTLGGSSKSGDRVDSTIVNQVASTIKQDAKSRGRVDKRPAAKAERKEQALKNKQKKQKNRDPFTRQKTFESFITECKLP